jgi:hypothetical protein
MTQKNSKYIALALAVFMRDNKFSYHDIMRALVVLGNASKEMKTIPQDSGKPKGAVLDLEQTCTT